MHNVSMGIEIDRTHFLDEDYQRFERALQENLSRLGKLLATPGFGVGGGSIGAELEMYIVDSAGRPLHINQELHAAAGDPQLTLELNRYNLEYNLSPQSLKATPFAATEAEITNKLSQLNEVAAGYGGRIATIGILPTLSQDDFGANCITDRKRYHALVSRLLARRGGPFKIDINGEDPLQLEMDDITLEGANTSFQVHYRVAPNCYAETFNAFQLMTPLALAIGANSPTLFGHNLWHETRVALFKQSIDTRREDHYVWSEPARVSYGQGWVRHDALELFAEVANIYAPLLPICAPQSSQPGSLDDAPPSLAELRLHQSTVWLWNRPVYDDASGGHLRIEMRALPAGPTAIDMVANAAFLIGLAEGIRPQLEQLLVAIPFRVAESNFYRAAQHGLDAKLEWPQRGKLGHREQAVCTLIDQLLPVAYDGLRAIGIDTDEASLYLGVIEQRLRRRQNGASWQRAMLASLRQTMPLDRALTELLEIFMQHSKDNIPVSEWPL